MRWTPLRAWLFTAAIGAAVGGCASTPSAPSRDAPDGPVASVAHPAAPAPQRADSSPEARRAKGEGAAEGAPGREAAPGAAAANAVPALAEPPHGSFTGYFRTHFSAEAWHDNVWRDYLATPSVIFPAVLAAGAIAVHPYDHRLERRIRGTLGGRPMIGNIALWTLVAGSIADGLLFPGPGRTRWDEIWDEAESYGVTFGTTVLLKTTVHRNRPYGNASIDSFPSGHVSAAFAAATLIDRNSGHGAGAPAYAIAALTGYSRVETGHHFPSDVLAGAALGVFATSVIDVLHFGAGREGRGIAGARLSVGSGPEGGFGAELSIRF